VAVTLETVLLLVLLVQLVQWGGERLAVRRQWRPLLWMGGFLGCVCLVSQLWMGATSTEPVIRVGVMSGWPEEVMQVAQRVADQQYHLKIKIVPFSDYVLPNTALQNGDIDVNIFQHVPYLVAQVHARGFKLVPIAKTFVYPMGFYSDREQTLATLKRGAIVAIPNDPSNEARALLLLQKAGLIVLKQHADGSVSLHDVIRNPKQLQLKTMDAAQLPRALQDADLVALTNDYLAPAHRTIIDAVIKEGSDSQYANVIVVRASDQNDPSLKELVAVMHSPEVVAATNKLFPKGAAIPAW
jgi:D-methionine transport system substrate-binding protein